MAHTVMKIGSMMVAFTVVAEMNADSTRLMMRKLQRTPLALLPNFITKASASLLANCVLTSMLAKTNDKILSHMTGCPSCARASFCVVTLHITMPNIINKEVR